MPSSYHHGLPGVRPLTAEETSRIDPVVRLMDRVSSLELQVRELQALHAEATGRAEAMRTVLFELANEMGRRGNAGLADYIQETMRRVWQQRYRHLDMEAPDVR